MSGLLQREAAVGAGTNWGRSVAGAGRQLVLTEELRPPLILHEHTSRARPPLLPPLPTGLRTGQARPAGLPGDLPRGNQPRGQGDAALRGAHRPAHQALREAGGPADRHCGGRGEWRLRRVHRLLGRAPAWWVRWAQPGPAVARAPPGAHEGAGCRRQRPTKEHAAAVGATSGLLLHLPCRPQTPACESPCTFAGAHNQEARHPSGPVHGTLPMVATGESRFLCGCQAVPEALRLADRPALPWEAPPCSAAARSLHVPLNPRVPPTACLSRNNRWRSCTCGTSWTPTRGSSGAAGRCCVCAVPAALRCWPFEPCCRGALFATRCSALRLACVDPARTSGTASA